ncbi:MAG: PqqD family protein [Acidimicrobiales bacterium]
MRSPSEHPEGGGVHGGGIDETFVPRARASMALAELDGEAVVLDEDHEVVHVLNATATLVWSRCDGSASLADIISNLATSLGVDRQEVHDDVVEVVRLFARRRLLQAPPP